MATENTIVPGPYTYTSTSYFQTNPAKFNRTVLASAGFIATGSYASPSGFYQSGSAAATVTLINGGSMTIPAAAAASPTSIIEIGVYSVDAGAVYLLYK